MITEAKLDWHLLGNNDGDFYFRLVVGRFWWPFGIHNAEWFSALNRFAVLSPAAGQVLPAHYNEVGVMGEGEIRLSGDLGLNYLAAVGNGVPGFGLAGNVRGTRFDTNNNRTVTGRLGLVLNGPIRAELGFSIAGGRLRARLDNERGLGDPSRYRASFTAIGQDLSVRLGPFSLRSYYYRSIEDFTDAPVNELARDGLVLEPVYTIAFERDSLKSLSLIGRFSYAAEDVFTGGEFRRTQLGLSLYAHIKSSFIAKLSYVAHDEDKDLPEVDDDLLNISLTKEF